MHLPKYSIGTGDRFGMQAKAQLKAVVQALAHGLDLAIVWNKSHREHTIVGSTPAAVRAAAAQAVGEMGWQGAYFVDADHVGLGNVDLFMQSSDFFTIDVADFIGQTPDPGALAEFTRKHADLVGELTIPGLPRPLGMTSDMLQAIARKYFSAALAAGEIYRHIAHKRGASTFVTEVSMDETADPQSPLELLLILAALADQGIPVQTIAPKFSGRFNKGVDYVGDVSRFCQEFEADLCVLRYAVRAFGLPGNLKLSIHSGSDKFSIYGPMGRLIRKHDAGLHLKTAGTTWLEELIGLAEAGGEGLRIAKRIYAATYGRYDEMCGPYASVIDIDTERLPLPADLQTWTADQYVEALRHDPACPAFNLHLRQLLHVGYKVAAEMGEAYLAALDENELVVARNVTDNLFERHIVPLFINPM